MSMTFQWNDWWKLRGNSAESRRQRKVMRSLDLNGRGAERLATPKYRWEAGLVDLADRLSVTRHK